MIIIEISYKKSLDEVNNLLQKHRDFLDLYYKEGIFLASGPKNPRTGGVILSMSEKEIVNKIIEEDPFYSDGIADYRIIEFEVNKCTDGFKSFLNRK